MSSGQWIILIAIWTGTTLLSLASLCLRSASRSRLQELCRQQGNEARATAILAAQEPLSLRLDALAILGAMLGNLLVPLGWDATETTGAWWLWLAVSVGLTLSTLYLLPVVLRRVCGEGWLLRTWSVWTLLGQLISPLFTLRDALRRWSDSFQEPEQEGEAEEDLAEEIREIVNAGQREGLIENDEREMIESVMDLADATIAQIMTPRIEMVSISVDVSWDELLRLTSESGHSRLPVHGKSRDEIVGVLHIKDVLVELARGQRQRRPLRALLRRPFFVPETKPVNEMLQEFQRGRTHIAVVLDEYGGVSGLVTIEDVLEEIVGEIADEHDEALVDGLKQLDENTYEAHARMRIGDWNERTGKVLPDEESFDTLGGYVFHELGRIPNVGEQLERHGLRIKILDSNRRRIDRILIEVLPPPAEDASGESAEKAAASSEAGSA
jgi:CBS domain containing-hemolysin-like protein